MKPPVARLSRERDQIRRVFNRHSQNENPTEADLAFLQNKMDALALLDKAIHAAWLSDEEFDEEVYSADCEECDEFTQRWLTLKLKSQKDTEHKGNNKHNLKLPKLELRKFDDNPKNWLAFWGQFRKIHEDKQLSNDDKFQYLLQSLKEGSKARALVESFPPSEENYKNAVEQLEDRFAKKEILTQIYIRELISLCSQNTNLSDLYTKITTYLYSLQSLGISNDTYRTILYPIVESALPESTISNFNRSGKDKQLENLLKFLKLEVDSESSIKLAKAGGSSTGNSGSQEHNQTTSTEGKVPTAACILANIRSEKKQTSGELLCCFCSRNNHNTFECAKAYKMTLDQKKFAIRQSGCCYICLKRGHLASKCKTFVKCISCSKKHYVFLCPNVHSDIGKKENVLFNQKNNETLLQTLMVKITHNNKWKKVRALLDSGSQRSYVKSSVVEELQLQHVDKESITQTVFGGEIRPAKVVKSFELQVSDLSDSYNTKVIALEQVNLCGHLPKIIDKTVISKLKSLKIEISDILVADTEIGLLIGADYLGSIMTNNLIAFDNNLIGVQTKLGWTIQGPTSYSNSVVTNTVASVMYASQPDVSDLWNIELLGIQDPHEQKNKKVVEKEMLKTFNDNISVNAEDRYEVSLLWKEGYPEPNTNYGVALKRLQGTTKKLLTTGNLQNYNKIFEDWRNNNIIQRIEDDNQNKGHYLPHHAVIKPTSSTTQVRPVFDGSAKDMNGLSLNNCIDKGMNLIELIPKLLILFRKGAYGVTADIAKAFLQISVSESDREYMKFLWWEDADRRDKIVAYKHNRVVFGINCSPFLLSATINYHLDNCCQVYSKTAERLKTSFYVDNCITSFDTRIELNSFISQSKEIMALAKFDLRDWVTAPETCSTAPEVHVLGMTWNTKHDELYCKMNMIGCTGGKITKRYLLSLTQRIFDPLGVLCPVTIIPKLILQKLWEKKYDWDEEISSELAHEVKKWQSTLNMLAHCKIPRRVTIAPLTQTVNSLHTFCDASKDAYAAGVFLRTELKDTVHIQLILAKSRVAPAGKKMTLPRLELMAAVIASRLYAEVVNTGLLAECSNHKTHFWTDSSVVIDWLKQQRQWKPFVSNRVREICSNTNVNDWRHVPGEQNPADLPSRGCDTKKLLESRWWEGPLWLRRPCHEWPMSTTSETNKREEVREEEKKQTVVNVESTSTPFSARLTYFSKYTKTVRLVAWLLRFNPKIREKSGRAQNITTEEYKNAEKTLIKVIQKEHFLEGENTLPKNLNTKVDKDGIIRVKTRLELSHEHEDFVSPTLLPGRNKIVQRLVQQRHENLKHAGTQLLLSELRNDFWILSIRHLVKKTVSDCVICKRYKSKHYEVPEAPLPLDRIENMTAFRTTGVDFAGPLILRNQEKCWIALFTCATYRAVHLELVESLSTPSFMMALRRFTARRGRVSTIYSDNGTNFQGTANLLKNIDWAEIEASTVTMTSEPIKWKFIVPAAPWWGGWWERLVRVLKEILRRVLGTASVTWIELSTILCECEAVINSRPLTYVETDSDSLRPLTPMMFLHGMPSADTPDLDHIDAKSANMRLRYMEKLRSDFRQRFRKEYIAMLTSKNRCKTSSPAVGDIVLVEADSGRLHWPLGIIKELVTGSDGFARVARVKMATGEKTRACQRLYPLELSAVTEEWSRTPTDDGQGKAERHDLPADSNCDLERRAPRSSDDTRDTPVSGGTQPSATTRLGRVVKLPRRFLD